MADKDAMIAAVKTHCRAESEGDRDAWVALFADDAMIEDPVGSGNIHRGIEAIANVFWERAQSHKPQVQLLEKPIACGSEVIALIKAEIGPEGARQTYAPIVAHFVFDDHAKVESLRAFFEY